MLEVDHYRFQADRARRMADRVTDALVKEKLLEMMRHIPEALQPLFAPRWAEGTMYFSLWEAVIVARRSS